MEALRAEIERKRKAKQADFGGQKWAKVADLTAAREAAERALGGKTETQLATAPQPDVPPLADEPAPAAAPDAALDLPAELAALSDADVTTRLRALSQPAILFGESRPDRLLRLHIATRAAAQAAAEAELRGKSAQGNERQRALKALDAAARAKSARKEGDPAAAPEDPTAAAFAAAAAALAAQRAEAALDPPARVALALRRLMEEWEAETEERATANPAWAASTEGRTAVSTCRLSREHIRPLFRLLKRREVPADIERALWCIVKALAERNYREAGDLYVRVAIGNAPWPIGVTMVGIHERSAREKISATSTAHVLHDEQSRKYLQAVKRLITFAQRKYPSTPSRSMEFDGGANGSDKQALLALEAARAEGGAPPLALEWRAAAAPGMDKDGWRANERDTRTWKSVMRQAEREMKADGNKGGA